MVYFGSGENLWVDHCTFVGHSDYNTASTGLPDWDKFLACCYDADYCTVSDSSIGLHEYGVILGYPDDSESNYSKYDGYPNMSLISNKFKQTLTRGPGLMRWGYYHSLNNFVDTFSMAFTVQSDCKRTHTSQAAEMSAVTGDSPRIRAILPIRVRFSTKLTEQA